MKIHKIKNIILRQYIKKQNEEMQKFIAAQHNFAQDIEKFILVEQSSREKNALQKINCKKIDKSVIKI